MAMTTQPPSQTAMTSYGQPAPMSLPTPSYDDPLQNVTDPSYKSLPPAAQDVSYKPRPPPQDQPYKPSKDPGYDSSYRPLPSNQDVSLYKPITQPGPDPSYPSDLAYQTLPSPSGFSYTGPPPLQPQLPPYIPGPTSGPGPLGNMASTASIPSFHPPPNTQQQQQQAPATETMAGPAATTMATTTALPVSMSTKEGGIKDTLSITESALREYMSMQRRRQSKGEAGIEDRLRTQASTVLGDLQALRLEVADLVREAESHRWRKFLIGGAIASFVPLVKKLFPRPTRHNEASASTDTGSHDDTTVAASNNTEYAFRKSKSLISRILEATRRPGIATVAFFVFAVLYVFQNEVSLQVGRTVTKRLKRLTTKVEGGIEEISEEDLKMLRGWRWRVLIWSE